MRLNNGHVLGAAGCLAPFMGVVAPLGLPIVLIGAALAAIVVRRRRAHAWPTPPPALALLIGALIAWAGLSLIWSIDPGAGFAKLPIFAVLLVAGLVVVDSAIGLSNEERIVFARLSVAGFGIAVALLLFERVADAPIRRLTSTDVPSWDVMLDTFNRSVSALVLLVWPAALIVSRRHRAWGAAAWLLALVTVWFYSSNAAIAAMVVGAAAYALGRLFPRWSVRVLGALLVAGVLASPLFPSIVPSPATLSERVPGLSYSGYHRLVIWEFTAKRIGERPMLGWGFDASRSIPGRDSRTENGFTALPLHPHNAVLQWWLELGVVGALLGAATIGWLFTVIDRASGDPIARAACLGLVVTAITICSLGFGIWQSWWLAALWLSGTFMVAASRRTDPSS